MYTLPDFFSQQQNKQDEVIGLCESDGTSKLQQWTENIEE
jgi:hypothetical protein